MTQTRTLAGWIAAATLVAGTGGFLIARATAPVTPVKAAPAAAASAAPQPDVLTLSPSAISAAGIAVETVNDGGLGAEVIAAATATAPPQGQAVLTARAAGAVTRIFKRLGDPVRRGEPLAIVESREAAQIAADRRTASARASLSAKALARERSLYQQRVSPRVDLEQAEAEAAVAAAEAQRTRAAASVAGITADGRGVVVTSPISGQVSSSSASLGAFVQPETELFRVSDPRRIQIEAAVGLVDARRIAAGDRAVIEAGDGRTVAAMVRAVTPTLDAGTRQVTAILEPSAGSFRPGQSLRVRITPRATAASTGIVVPDDAVQSVAGRDTVFVRTAAGFEPRVVTIGQRSGGRAEVVAGLAAGQQVATHNAFRLKAALAAGSGGEGEH